MTAYKSKYTTPGPKKVGVPRRVLRWIGGLFKRSKRRTGGRPQVAVTRSQRNWKINKLSQNSVVALILLFFIGGSGWFVYGKLSKSDIFRLTRVAVQGCTMVTKQQVMNMAGLEQGMNLFALDVDLAVKRIADQPWIDHAQVERHWPSMVTITVREHRPLALINLEEEGKKRLYYVDRRGMVFAPVDKGQDIDFPVITGQVDATELKERRFAEAGPASKALKFLLLAAGGSAVLPIQAISEIHVDQQQGLIAYLVEHPFPIYLGQDTLQTKYYRLVKILDRLYRGKKLHEIKEIRMDYFDDKVLVAKLES
ncbi:MAG: FtsQ-type POTRA domain-containing protein [Desulfobulbaceae bacterium]|nr:FtsQ-type POTRA domain-containing protein [Desulfobulbaceae bacterium]